MILAIDPGATGAAALLGTRMELLSMGDLDKDPAVVVFRLDVLYDRAMNENGDRDLFAIVERAQAMPGQGLASTAHYMTGYGVLLGWLHARRISHDTVHPAKWKRAMGLGKDKAVALAMARRIFPTADLSKKCHHNRAEALLLAEWARQSRIGAERVTP